MKDINPKIKTVWKELGDTGFDTLISALECENTACNEYGKSPKPVVNRDAKTVLSQNMDIGCECGDLYKKVEYVVTRFRQK